MNTTGYVYGYHWIHSQRSIRDTPHPIRVGVSVDPKTERITNMKQPPSLNGNNHPDVLTIVALLDAHDIPPHYSVRQTQTWLQQQGFKYRQNKIVHALRQYREYYLPGLPTK